MHVDAERLLPEQLAVTVEHVEGAVIELAATSEPSSATGRVVHRQRRPVLPLGLARRHRADRRCGLRRRPQSTCRPQDIGAGDAVAGHELPDRAYRRGQPAWSRLSSRADGDPVAGRVDRRGRIRPPVTNLRKTALLRLGGERASTMSAITSRVHRVSGRAMQRRSSKAFFTQESYCRRSRSRLGAGRLSPDRLTSDGATRRLSDQSDRQLWY